MKRILSSILCLICLTVTKGQELPEKEAYSYDIKQIHSGHSLTDPLFHPHWPGAFVNLLGILNNTPAWELNGTMIGKSTIPGSSLKYRWENEVGHGNPEARTGIDEWELLITTERVPLNYEGGSTQQWYLDGIQEQKTYLSNFVNNAWNNGNNGDGAPTLLWTTWTNIDNSNGPWREMLDTQGLEFERMQDYANQNRPRSAPPVYIIPGHKMMARLFDDIQDEKVPGITQINQFFSDNIHTNELGAYAICLIHYACIFNKSPVGLTNNLYPDASQGTPIPSAELAKYLQEMVWDVVTSYPRSGIRDSATISIENLTQPKFKIYPNPTKDYIFVEGQGISGTQEYEILNAMGQTLLKTDQKKIFIGDLPSGLYFLKTNQQVVRFVK